MLRHFAGPRAGGEQGREGADAGPVPFASAPPAGGADAAAANTAAAARALPPVTSPDGAAALDLGRTMDAGPALQPAPAPAPTSAPAAAPAGAGAELSPFSPAEETVAPRLPASHPPYPPPPSPPVAPL